MGSPFCTATLLFMSNTAPAPSLIWLEFPEEEPPHDQMDRNKLTNYEKRKGSRGIPAVVVPSFLNTVFNFPRPATDVSGRIPSSTDTTMGFSSPVLGSTIFEQKNANKKNRLHFQFFSQKWLMFYSIHSTRYTFVATGMISSLNLPEAVAAAAFLWEST